MPLIPKIAPIALKEYKTKQSKYDIVGSPPLRQILLSPSGGGKTLMITNFILDIYRDVFERVYIFSPSINVDHTWVPVKNYLDKK
jgi:hypothetical protein